MKHVYKMGRFSRNVACGFAFLFLTLLSSAAIGQTQVNTNHIDNNGNATVTFNVTNNNIYAIEITEFRCHSQSAGTSTVLYNATPPTNAGSWSSGVIADGQNGWALVGNGTSTNSNAQTPILTGINFNIPAGATYMFAVSIQSLGYMTLTAGAGQNTFSAGGVDIITGDGISWGGGAIPTSPGNYPRGFVGGISFIQGIPPQPNDAGISEFVTPQLPTCSFTDSVRVAMTNFGTDTLTSASIQWSVGGVLQAPFSWTGVLASAEIDTITLGYPTLVAGDDIIAYTTLPNGVNELPFGALNDTLSILNLQAGLSGIYTIGGTTPDYVDFTTAISDLTTFGICGSVIFDVRDGVYTEQVIIPSFSSSSASNTVTIRSESADASLVTLTWPTVGASDNYVMRIDGTDYLTIENMTIENTGGVTYARVLDFVTGSDFVKIEGCHLKGSTTATTNLNASVIHSASSLDNNNTFLNNTIEGGSYGMYWYGNGTTSSEAGNVIEGNHFLSNGQYGARMYYQDGLIFKNNVIDGSVSYTGTRYGLYGSYLNQAPQITGNTITGDGGNGWNYGLYWFNGGGTAAATGLVENNMINAGYPGFTGTGYGIYMSNIGYMDVTHNTVHFSNGGTNARAFYPVGGGANKAKNNIFSISGGGYAMYLTSAFTLSECDYNVLYAPNGNTGFLGGAQSTLTDWQTTGYDGNSLDNNPMFFSQTDLHVCNDSIGNQGTPIASIVMDIDGQMRSATTPDMGADEFSPLVGSFLGSDVDVCTGDSIMLAAGSPTDTILWSTGDTTAFIWVSTPGTYTVTINSPCGSGTDAIVVNQSALVYSNYVVASDLVFCNGDSVLLNGTQMADTYQWSGGSSSTNDSIYATVGGAYTLNISDGCGTGSETLVITMNDVPTASFTSTMSYLSGDFTNTSTSGGNTTYLWDFGDGTTSTDENPIHVYATGGEYTVTLTVTNDCGSTTITNQFFPSAVGLEELSNFGTINVYPNPSTGEFQLDLNVNETLNLDIVVTNVMGQELLVKSLNAINGSQTEKIDLSSEAVGVYYLNISSEGTLLSTQMIIKK